MPSDNNNDLKTYKWFNSKRKRFVYRMGSPYGMLICGKCFLKVGEALKPIGGKKISSGGSSGYVTQEFHCMCCGDIC